MIFVDASAWYVAIKADLETVLKQIRDQANIEDIRITQHAQQEMVEEDITLNEVLEAIAHRADFRKLS